MRSSASLATSPLSIVTAVQRRPPSVRATASVLLETRHVKAALSAMPVKTDRKDACGLAQLLRMERTGIRRVFVRETRRHLALAGP
jgi:hypothetical protein